MTWQDEREAEPEGGFPMTMIDGRDQDGSGSRRLRNLWRWITIAGLLVFSAFAWWYASRATATEIPHSRLKPPIVEDRVNAAVRRGAPSSAATMRTE